MSENVSRNLVEYAERSELFFGIEPSVLAALLELIRADLRVVRKGGFLVHEGMPAERIFIVVRGRLIVTEYVDDDRRHVVRDLRDGSVFGLTMLFRNDGKSTGWWDSDELPYWPCTCQAAEDSTLISFDLRKARRLSAVSDVRFHRVYLNTVRLLSDGMIDVLGKLSVLGGATVEDEVMNHLHRLDAVSGMTGVVTVPFNQCDWARYLAVGRSSLCRALRNLKAAGKISWCGRKFKLYSSSRGIR